MRLLLASLATMRIAKTHLVHFAQNLNPFHCVLREIYFKNESLCEISGG